MSSKRRKLEEAVGKLREVEIMLVQRMLTKRALKPRQIGRALISE